MIIVPTFVPVLPLMDIRPIKCDKSFCGDVVWRGDCIQLLMIRRREKDDHLYRFKSNMITKWFTISVRNWKILWRGKNDDSFLKWNGIRIGRRWDESWIQHVWLQNGIKSRVIRCVSRCLICQMNWNLEPNLGFDGRQGVVARVLCLTYMRGLKRLLLHFGSRIFNFDYEVWLTSLRFG